ncbi:MAG TPA: maleylacetoacetate isomerase, partial [Steroidobacteraceae bacterium]|nr:maleylacetoacetate isomerase [Steroidobacteraceae bacterium]
VPTLQSDGVFIPQSLAILEYLEEVFPEPPLLPKDSERRARVRSLAQICAVDTHPLNNLRVLKYLEKELGLDERARLAWSARWFSACFGALEARLANEPETGRFCHGDTPTFADVCLQPQVWGARRFGFDLAPYPTVCRVSASAAAMDAFERALPSRQPDAE